MRLEENGNRAVSGNRQKLSAPLDQPAEYSSRRSGHTGRTEKSSAKIRYNHVNRSQTAICDREPGIPDAQRFGAPRFSTPGMSADADHRPKLRWRMGLSTGKTERDRANRLGLACTYFPCKFHGIFCRHRPRKGLAPRGAVARPFVARFRQISRRLLADFFGQSGPAPAEGFSRHRRWRRQMAVQRMASRRQTVAALAAAVACPAQSGAAKRGLARVELDSWD